MCNLPFSSRDVEIHFSETHSPICMCAKRPGRLRKVWAMLGLNNRPESWINYPSKQWAIYNRDISSANHNFVKTRANHSKKKSSKFTKKITHVDDMMIHNLVKYRVQTRLRLWVFLYLTNEVEFVQDILQDCVSSYHLHV